MPAERYAWALLLAAGSPLAAAGADAPAAPPPPAALDAELLEFLGEFHDAQGEFVDPFVIDAVGTVIDDAEREAKTKPKSQPTQTEQTVASPATQAPPAAQPEKQP